MASITFLGFTIVKSQGEKEIQKLFAQYEKILLAQKQKMCDDITEWGDAITQSIYKHANLQKSYLEDAYAKRVQYLNAVYNQFIEDLRVREEINNTEEIDALVEQCKELKFELAALETTVQTIPYIEVPFAKKRVIKKQDDFDAAEIGMSSNNTDSTEKDDNELESDMNTHSILYPSLSSENTRQAGARPQRKTSVDSHNRSINDNGDQKFSNAKDNGFAKKCPICFMIFPLTMTAPDRIQHVQEHYANE